MRYLAQQHRRALRIHLNLTQSSANASASAPLFYPAARKDLRCWATLDNGRRPFLMQVRLASTRYLPGEKAMATWLRNCMQVRGAPRWTALLACQAPSTFQWQTEALGDSGGKEPWGCPRLDTETAQMLNIWR